MTASTFDTLGAARELEASGIERQQAEAIAGAIRNGQGDLVTKADLAIVKADLGAVEADLGAVPAELANVRRVVGIQSAVTLATFAIVAAKLP